MAFDFSTLITDRTQQDVDYARQLVDKLVTGTATDAEKAEWNSFTLKGAYNHTDLNRVTAAMEALKAKLEGYGYAVPGYQRIKVPHVLPEPEPTSRLPEGYTELTHIESTGTQYIDTGFKPNQDTRVVMDFDAVSAPNGTATLFSARGNGTSGSWSVNAFALFAQSGFSKLVDQYASTYVTPFASAGGRHVVDKNKNVTILDGNEIQRFTYTAFTSAVQLRLLYDNQPNGGDGHPFGGKLYSCQIYDNGTLVRDYVPCKNASGVVGLYDIANGVFYQNAGTGAFAAGEEVASPATASVMVVSGNADEYDHYTWYEFDWPTPETMTIYLLNVAAIRSVLAVLQSTPNAPSDMGRLMAQEANNIEVILLDVCRQLSIMPTTFIPCGEALCGGDNL